MKKKNIYSAALALIMAFATPLTGEMQAQSTLPEGAHPMIVVPHSHTVDYRERTLLVDVTANIDYTITTDASWVRIHKGKNGNTYLHLDFNSEMNERKANVTFANEEKNIAQTLEIVQRLNESATEAPEYGDAAYNIFADSLYSTLKEEVKQTDIDTIRNSFVKTLAQKIYDGQYSTRYRVQKYPCTLDPSTLSSKNKVGGYDRTAGVTGISMAPGKHGLVVTGLPEGKKASLKVVAWFNGYGITESGFNSQGNEQEKTYELHNGINVIDFQPEMMWRFKGAYIPDYNALAYIDYVDAEAPEKNSDLGVHFLFGEENGILSLEYTDEQMHEMTAKAKNYCIDLVGSKAHNVWTAKGLRQYCKGSDGVSLGYRQWINFIDSLITWEQEALGWIKYDRVPNIKTLGYVNFTYFMFCGGKGASFRWDTQNGHLNVKSLMGGCWGEAHEWGHQHQMGPYAKWGGLGEVSNNWLSYYVEAKTGKYNGWLNGNERNKVWDLNFKLNNTDSKTNTYSQRKNAAANASRYSYSPKMKEKCLEMANYSNGGTMPTVTEDSARAFHHVELGLAERLAPFVFLANYAMIEKGMKDWWPDLFEALRTTDSEGGSTVEKQGFVDKYELIAAAQNGNKNNSYALLAEKYPSSCWVVDNYLNGGKDMTYNAVPYALNFIRKASRLLGYNLTPYFERWGFLRQVALWGTDYGNDPHVMTREMCEEFIADMKALEDDGTLQHMDDQMMEKVFFYRHLNDQSLGKKYWNVPVIAK